MSLHLFVVLSVSGVASCPGGLSMLHFLVHNLYTAVCLAVCLAPLARDTFHNHLRALTQYAQTTNNCLTVGLPYKEMGHFSNGDTYCCPNNLEMGLCHD